MKVFIVNSEFSIKNNFHLYIKCMDKVIFSKSEFSVWRISGTSTHLVVIVIITITNKRKSVSIQICR